MQRIPHDPGGAPAGYLPSPHLEVLSRSPERAAVPRLPWYRARRLAIFAIVVLAVLIPGLVWDFSRPAQYRAAATVLTAATPIPGSAVSGGPVPPSADVQYSAIQSRVLLGQELLAHALEQVAPGGGILPVTPDRLREMLRVTPVPDTQLVELAAEGGEPQLLAAIVNAWIAAYQEQRREAVEREVGEARASLRGEHESLSGTIAARRAALDAFRAEHDIVTLERDGNESLARLRALNEDLNRARDEAVEAQARLAALEEAIARGDPVIPSSEQGNLAVLEEKAVELRARLSELGKRYTAFYLENEPDVRVIPAQLAEIEAKIEDKLEQGRRLMLTRARGEVDQARRRVQVLEGDLARVKDAAAVFSARFAEHQALVDDLGRLEALYRDAGTRLVEMEARALERFPAVEVIDPAFPPTAPFHPRYLRDALIVLAAALGAGIAVILLFEFLTRAPRTAAGSEPAQVTGVRVYMGGAPGGPPLAAGGAGAVIAGPGAVTAFPAAEAAGPASLPAALPRELIAAEVGALWTLADPLSRQLLVLLLSGLTLEECAALSAERFDLAGPAVLPPSHPPRRVPLPPHALPLLARSVPLPLWAGDGQTPEELEARIALLSFDAGLNRPAEVTGAVLRHTWLAFLVRQGARLTELEGLAGRIPAAALARYAPLAPPGPARPLSEVDPVYPLPV